MKKENVKYIFAIFIIIALFLAGFFVTRSNYNKTNDNSINVIESNNVNTIEDNKEEVTLGDEKTSCKTKDYARCGCNSISDYYGQMQCNASCGYCLECYDGAWLKDDHFCWKASQAPNICCCKSSNPTNCTYRSHCQSDEGPGTNCGGSTVVVTPTPEPCPSYQHRANGVCVDYKLSRIQVVDMDNVADSWYFSVDDATRSPSYYAKVNPFYSKVRNWKITGNFVIEQKEDNGMIFVIKNFERGKGNSCAVNKGVITASNNTNKVTKDISVCVYCNEWYTASGFWKVTGKADKSMSSYTPGCDFFSGGDGSVYYTEYYGRCCPKRVPESDYGFCYGDEPYIGIATPSSVRWIDGPPQTNGLYRYEYIKDKKNCVPMESVSACKSGSSTSKSREVSATDCEGRVLLSTDNSSKVCASDSRSFYEINCQTDVIADFDMDDNVVNTNYNIHGGQGFKYDVDLSETTKCVAKFYANEWVNAYNKVMEKMKTIKAIKQNTESAYDAYKQNSSTAYQNFYNKLERIDGSLFTNKTRSEIFNLYTLARDIEQIVIDYNEHSISNETKAEANLKMSYSLKSEENVKSYNYKFDANKTSCKPVNTSGKTHNEIPAAASWLKAPKDYTIIYSKTVDIKPQSISISKIDGKAVQETKKVLAGGNKIYIDNDAKVQTIDTKVIITGLARNNSSIKNEKCKVKITDKDITYRPIDINNPFISDSWKKGENWSNNKYDFTKVIHNNVWSGKSLYTISLSKSMITAVKKSNRSLSNSSAYLGTCDKIDNQFPDVATKHICSQIK